jgi:amino acid transporter
MNNLSIFAVILIALGILGVATPYFATTSTKDVVTLGDMKLQSTDTTWHAVPVELAGGAIVLGIILLGVGIYRKP